MIKKLLLTICLLALPFQVFGASISTLTDNFNDNSIDVAKWANNGWLEQNQELEETTELLGSDKYIQSQNTYDLTNSSTTLKIIDAGNTALASRYFTPIVLSRTFGSAELVWYINGGNIKAAGQNGAYYSGSYVAATFKYLRIRCVGTTIYWDYSADGISWTNATSETANIVITSLVVWIEDYVEIELSTTTAKVDDFNILPSATRRIIFIQ